jgi:osmoprotectant transport system ATP-binding protein
MTVAENVAVVPKLLKWEPPRIAARVDELLTLVDLPPAEYRDRYPSQLSGGQQQRVGVARALAGDPGVILMDEPFGAVDAITRTGLQDELLHLQRQLHKTILFVTHDVEEALRLADKIVIMREGQIVQYASPVELLAHPADQFVRDLTGADDVVRQLGLIRVETVMESLPRESVTNGRATNGPATNGRATIPCDDNLRRALSLLLASGDATLTVLDDDKPVGVITLAAIRAVAGSNGAGEQGSRGEGE